MLQLPAGVYLYGDQREKSVLYIRADYVLIANQLLANESDFAVIGTPGIGKVSQTQRSIYRDAVAASSHCAYVLVV